MEARHHLVGNADASGRAPVGRRVRKRFKRASFELDRLTDGALKVLGVEAGDGVSTVTGNDPLLACGYLKYSGCLINLNGGDREAWTLRDAEAYAKLLALAEDGRIVWRAAPESAPADASVNQTDLEGPGR